MIFQIAGILFQRDGGNEVGILLSAVSKALFGAVGILGFIGVRILRRQRESKLLLTELKRQGELHTESQGGCPDFQITDD